MDFLPQPYRDIAIAFCELIAAASVLAALLKPLAGTPHPNDGPVRKVLFGALHALDWLAANTATIRSKRQLAATKAELHDVLSQPPPPRGEP